MVYPSIIAYHLGSMIFRSAWDVASEVNMLYPRSFSATHYPRLDCTTCHHAKNEASGQHLKALTYSAISDEKPKGPRIGGRVSQRAVTKEPGSLNVGKIEVARQSEEKLGQCEL
jgi:hypothetical protein